MELLDPSGHRTTSMDLHTSPRGSILTGGRSPPLRASNNLDEVDILHQEGRSLRAVVARPSGN
jgi:hypothetical protein